METVRTAVRKFVELPLLDFVDSFPPQVTFPKHIYILYFNLGILSNTMNPVAYGLLNKNF